MICHFSELSRPRNYLEALVKSKVRNIYYQLKNQNPRVPVLLLTDVSLNSYNQAKMDVLVCWDGQGVWKHT